MVAEMKMAAGLAENILTAEPMLSRIEALFCSTETESPSQATVLATEFVDDMMNDGAGRRLRANAFLESRLTRDSHREEFWHRQLQDSDDDLCKDMLASLELEVSPKGNTMMLTLPPDHRKDEFRECLHALVVDLVMQTEICYVGAYQQIETLNKLATGIVQSGSSTSTPFYDVGLDGLGQVVALSDTGLDTDGCYMWDATKEIQKDTSGRFNLDIRKVVQYVALGDDKENGGGHGTHVAGTIAGRRATDGKVESDGDGDGVARAAKLAFYDIGDGKTHETLRCIVQSRHFISLLYYFRLPDGGLDVPSASTLFTPGYKAGARIHSASWGTPNTNAYTVYDLQIDEYVYENKEFLFVIAVGNAGRGNAANTVSSPAIAKNGISVGASQNTGDHIKDDQQGPDYLIDFSSRGPTKDGRRKPDVVAPGQFILSAKAVADVVGECDDTSNYGLQFKKGTSMAAPVVSGTAALVRQYFEEGWHLTGSPQPSSGFRPMASLVKAVLLNGAQELIGIEDGDGKITNSKAYDRNQGFGRVNLLRSVPLASKNDIDAVFVNAQRIGNGGVDKYEVLINKSGCSDPLSATLVWTDIPGSPSCNQGCVLNDVDLFVTQNGRSGRFFPNGLGSADTVNNVERVRIENPTDGATYVIHVRGSQLLQPQDYSLVITGCFSQNDISNPDPTPRPSTPPTASPTNPPTKAPNRETSNGEPDDTSSQTSLCVDSPTGTISINAGRTEDCTWLARNLNSFDYLCRFLDVALACPVTCDTCSLFPPASGNAGGEESIESSLQTAFSSLDGKVRWFGSTFDVQTKQNPVTVRGFDIHISTPGQYAVQVLTRPGKASKATGGWTVICETTVTSPGRGELTEIPSSVCTPVEIAATSSQTFYITLGGGAPELILTDEAGVVDKAIINNGDLRVGSGFAVTYFDLDYFEGFSLNGSIRYTVTTSTQVQPEPIPCNDKSGMVAMDDTVGRRTCAWLSDNFDRFDFVCQFAVPSLHCPDTCGVCSQLLSKQLD
jgi:subtilisin family serine protease